jgi:RHS repeat-associated protein
MPVVYDLAGWMTEKRVPVEQRLDEILYNVTVYKYDKAGNRTEEKRSPEYVGKEENPKEWNTISYKYDKNNRVVEISDSTGAEIKYSYDCLGNRKYESKKINSNTYNVKKYFYDSVGLLYRVKEEIAELKIDRYQKTPGAETYYEYDPNGNITKVVTPEGYESEIHYDAVDRITEIIKTNPKDEDFKRITTYDYDKAGNITKETDCNGNTISYEYDAMNRQTKITDKEGGVTRLFYDASGNIIKQVTPENYNEIEDNGKSTSYSYDSMNRLVEVTNALGVIVQRNKYNEVGELIKKEDASKTGVEYSYDIGGRVKNIITPGAKEKGVVSQEYCYDALGNVTGIIDGEGNITKYKLDNWGKIKEVEKADGSKEWYDYDYAGNVVSTMDGNGNKTEYSYNSMNLLAEIKDAAGESMIYQYDNQGRLARQTDRNKNIIEYVYNQDDKIVTKRDVGTGTAEFYNYNIDGSLASAAVNGQVYNYTYTANNRLKSKNVNGKTVLEYGYNKGGKVTELVDVVGRKTSYKYDIIGRMEEVWDGDVRSAAYTYNPDNTIAGVRYGNGVDVNYGYDLDKNIAGILGKNREGKDLLNHSYSYDSNGNQIRKDEEGAVTSYAYDRLNRLGEVVYPNNTIETFGYDNVGNRVARSLNSEVTSYAYDSRNRLTSLNVGENVTKYQYDNQGNLLEEITKQGAKAYTYDCFNRTASVTNPDGSYIKNSYDPEGLRSEINENGVISRFVFDRGSVVTELDGENNFKSGYVRGYELISQRDSKDDSYYYFNNYHGDVVGLTDEVGNVVNRYKYDAFGNTVESKEQVNNRFRYSGEQYDSVTNQYYLRARFYNPVVGRFTQEDEYRGDGLNLYAYVGNNPINYVDPSGYSCKDSASKENVFEENNGPGGSNVRGGQTEIVLPSKPHTNGTEGHWETILDEVDNMSNSGDYSKIYVNKGLSNEIPGAKPNRRPDVMGVRNDGTIDQVEVPSKTDDPADLIERMIDNQRIIGDRAGTIKVIPIDK